MAFAASAERRPVAATAIPALLITVVSIIRIVPVVAARCFRARAAISSFTINHGRTRTSVLTADVYLVDRNELPPAGLSRGCGGRRRGQKNKRADEDGSSNKSHGKYRLTEFNRCQCKTSAESLNPSDWPVSVLRSCPGVHHCEHYKEMTPSTSDARLYTSITSWADVIWMRAVTLR